MKKVLLAIFALAALAVGTVSFTTASDIHIYNNTDLASDIHIYNDQELASDIHIYNDALASDIHIYSTEA